MAELTWGKPSKFQKAPAETPVGQEYALTKDTAVEAGKAYYSKDGDAYQKVETPEAGSLSAYYEKCWTDLDTPKEGTLQLSTNDGQETTATEEGGEVVDVRYGKTTYAVQWTQFLKRSVPNDFDDEDGVVAQETALRWLPEDPTLAGVYIPRAKVRVSESFTTADGTLRAYSSRVLKPSQGKSVQKWQETPVA